MTQQLGIDATLRHTGLCLLRPGVSARFMTLHFPQSFPTSDYRLATLNALDELFGGSPPVEDTVWTIEIPPGGGKNAFQLQSTVRAVGVWEGHSAHWGATLLLDPGVSTWRKIALGNGNATKQDAMDAADKYLDSIGQFWNRWTNDHEAEALGLAMYGHIATQPKPDTAIAPKRRKGQITCI